MIPIPLLKKIKLTTFSNVSDAVTALATVAIISMDLGLPYSESEASFYTHPLIQVIAVFCVGYQMLENISLSGIILVVWLVIKYFKHLKPHLLKKK
jgi:hypothetical protein